MSVGVGVGVGVVVAVCVGVCIGDVMAVGVGVAVAILLASLLWIPKEDQSDHHFPHRLSYFAVKDVALCPF